MVLERPISTDPGRATEAMRIPPSRILLIILLMAGVAYTVTDLVGPLVRGRQIENRLRADLGELKRLGVELGSRFPRDGENAADLPDEIQASARKLSISFGGAAVQRVLAHWDDRGQRWQVLRPRDVDAVPVLLCLIPKSPRGRVVFASGRLSECVITESAGSRRDGTETEEEVDLTIQGGKLRLRVNRIDGAATVTADQLNAP